MWNKKKIEDDVEDLKNINPREDKSPKEENISLEPKENIKNNNEKVFEKKKFKTKNIDKDNFNIEEHLEEANDENTQNVKKNYKPFNKDYKIIKDVNNTDNPKTSKNLKTVEIIPLGGLEEIGKNSAIIKYGEEMILIDVGLAFPDISMLGVDIVAPDFSYVNKNAKKLKAVIITHGHEDHIGSIEYFMRKFPNKDVPIYSSRFTLGLIKGKLNENWSSKKHNLVEVIGRQKVKVSENISVEFINITHSIPQSFSVAIHTPIGVIVHTGDFKFDLTPIDGRLTDFYKLAELGEKGVLALLSDSTNANKEEFTPSERLVGDNFRKVLERTKGRVIISSFSSHLNRVQQLATIANEFGRKTALDGRSMLKAFEVGIETGEMFVPTGCIIPLIKVPTMPENKSIIICTGTQGEQMSVLTRMSKGSHRDIKINSNDTVIISANFIPGNEKAILSVINDLMKKGAKVLYDKAQGLHVSGHGSRGDIRLMLNLIKPKYFVPVHGEYLHLKGNKDLAIEFGIKDENIPLIKNGDILSVCSEFAKVTGEVEFGSIMLEDDRKEGLEHNILKERQIMSKDGLVIILVTFDSKKRVLSTSPQIITKGYPFSSSSDQIIADLNDLMFQSYSTRQDMDYITLKRDIKEKAISLFKRVQKNPMILPVVITI